MWPPAVERFARVVRAAGVQGRLEELPLGADAAPGLVIRVVGFDCEGRSIVALVPGDEVVDRERLASVAGCSNLRPSPAPPFPFASARVLIHRSAFAESTVWLEAGSRRHLLGVAPNDLARLTRSQTAEFLLEN